MRALFTKRELVTFGVHWQERPGGEHRCEVLVSGRHGGMLLRPPGGGWKPDKRLKTVWGVDAFETRYLSTAQSRAKTRIRAVLNRKSPLR